MTDAGHDASPAVAGWQHILLTAGRVLAGGGSVLIGLYLGGMNATAYEAEGNVSVFSAVVITGGIILIAQARRRPRLRRAAWIAGTAAGAAGLLAAIVIPVSQTCCDTAWIVSLGLPLPWSTGHGDTWGQAVGEAWRGSWDPGSAIANVVFWAYAGMIVAGMIDLVRRGKRTRSLRR
jgi:hypothetical protein